VLNFAFETSELDLPRRLFVPLAMATAPALEVHRQGLHGRGLRGILQHRERGSILAGEVGVERAAYVLKNVRKELLGE